MRKDTLILKLNRHMKVFHEGAYDCSCEICGKDFKETNTLKNHMATKHSGNLFECSVCGKEFSQSSSLRRHMLLHSGEKPHVCNVCGKAFNLKSSLNNHMQA